MVNIVLHINLYLFMFLLFFSDDQNLQMSKDKGTQTCMETGEKAKNVEFQYIYIC